MSAMKIHGSEYTINKVFSDDFAFEIPHYQRPYSWSIEHASELLSDLLATLGTDDAPIEETPPYFLGCIVLIKPDGTVDSKVVDGQQRLTTLTILMAALREAIEDKSAAGDLTQFLYAKGNKMLKTSDRYRLLVRDRDRDFFQKFVQQDGGLQRLMKVDPKQLESTSQLNTWGNGVFLLDKAKKLPEATRQRLAMFLLNRCVLVVVSSPDLDSAYRIFSILNNRGLDLSHTDILKAEIIGNLPEGESEEYSEKWEDAENDLGVEDFKELFAHIRMIYRKQKMRETVLKEFREFVIPTHKAAALIDEVIIPFSQAFAEIKRANYESTSKAEEINGLFGWLNQIDNFDWMPPAIRFLTDHHDEPAALLKFFTHLERLAAAMMVLRVDITKRIERYGKLLTWMSSKDPYGTDSPLLLTDDERARALTALNGPIYTLKSVPNYVLLRLDGLLSEGEASYAHKIISIEHVLPQTPEEDSDWAMNFPDDEEREAWVHRLGNLVLLSRKKNSSARNYDFEKKKTKYFTTGGKSSPFALTSQVIHEEEWTPEVLEARQKDLLGKLKKLWWL
ncbi:hypothetical protein PHYC_01309 [Phycisphaerales bacterium]|nr:hypothetical protein PHYC_01309 [Phycisphaerales bacterium]